MTREEAIKDLVYVKNHVREIHAEAFNMAIESLGKTMCGEWEECEVVQESGDEPIIDEWQSARCSICGKYHTTPYMYHFDHFNYCPNCGAKMDERRTE